MNEDFVPDSKYFCPEHGLRDIVNNDFDCAICAKERSSIDEIRHKFMSSLTRIRYIYYFLLFSLIYNFLTFFIDFCVSLLTLDFDFMIGLKVFASILLVIFAEKELRKKL